VEEDPVFEDAIYSGTHVIVKDGNIITSGSVPTRRENERVNSKMERLD
jgi:hypothetical protein